MLSASLTPIATTFALALVWTSAAAAQGRPASETRDYCARVRAEAASQGTLLVGPRVELQGVKIPLGDETGSGVFSGNAYQLRAAMAWSPIELYEGVLVRRTADVECRRFEARETLRIHLESALQLGRREALIAQLEVLRSAHPEIDGLVAQARERRTRGIGILDEWMSLQTAAMRLRRHERRLEGELADAEIQGDEPDFAEALRALGHYEARSLDVTSLASALRRLHAVRFDVRGGVLPARDADWFATLTLSYELGAPRQRRLEADVGRARDRELHHAAYEARAQIEEHIRRLREQAAIIREELQLVESQIEMLEGHVDELEHAEGIDVFERLALARVEIVELRAEAAYLSVLLTRRSELPEVTDAR